MQRVKSLTLIREISTDGHSPLLFLCDDYQNYYCKYRSGVSLKSEEIDCLFYEIIASKLLNRLNVPTPELTLVEVSSNSYDIKQLKRHKRFCKPGQIYLGSKEIPNTELMHGINGIANKRSFNALYNPYDLVKIAFFDLWTDNCDRGKRENYNILIGQQGLKSKYYAFDHAFCFGGLDLLRVVSPLQTISTHEKLITSSYFKNILPYLDKRKAKKIIDNFLSLQTNEIENIIFESYCECPPDWGIPIQTKDRIISLLTSQERIDSLKNLMWSLFK